MPNDNNSSQDFDRSIEATAEQLDEIANQTLADEQIQEALSDPDHDDQW